MAFGFRQGGKGRGERGWGKVKNGTGEKRSRLFSKREKIAKNLTIFHKNLAINDFFQTFVSPWIPEAMMQFPRQSRFFLFMDGRRGTCLAMDYRSNKAASASVPKGRRNTAGGKRGAVGASATPGGRGGYDFKP